MSQSTVSYETLDGLTGGVAAASGSAPESSSTGSNGNAQPNDAKKTNIAAIVGGTIGGIAVVLLLVAAFFFMRRARNYEEMQSEKGDPHPPSSDMTSRSSSSMNPDPFRIPASSVFMIGLDAGNEKVALSREFGSSSASHSTSQTMPRSDTSGSVITDSATGEHYSSEDVPHPGAAGPAPIEALIAAAAPPEMSREQINLLAANFVSLVRGRRPQEESQEDESASEIQEQEPPPYQRG